MTASSKIIPSGSYNNIGVDYVNERTAGAGVTVDGVLIKDSAVDAVALTGIALSGWSPTITASGSMTVTGTSLYVADCIHLGKFCFFRFQASFTLAGTASSEIYISAPFAPINSNPQVGWSCVVSQAGAVVANACWRDSSSRIGVYIFTGANWALTATTVGIQGMIQTA